MNSTTTTEPEKTMNEDGRYLWLSQGAEVLVQEIEEAPAGALHCEVLIVGSGYGGAVAAARLAGARPFGGVDPVKVYVLERGNEYLPGQFPATFAELPGHVRFSMQDGEPPRGRATGLFDMRLGGDVNALLGNGLGGGSLINAAVMERPTPDAFGDKRWPKGIDLGSLDGDYSKAEAMLKPAQIPTSVLKLDSLLAVGAAIGAQESRKANVAIAFADGPSAAGVAMRKCLECGDCVSGCNHQAKQSLDVNYLALAQANGARLFCGATVHRLRQRSDGSGYAIEFFFTDPSKARSDRERPYVVHAHRVILAAGTLGSTEILLRSQGEELPMASNALGSSFSTNGDLIAVAYRQKQRAPSSALEDQAPDQRHLGPTITGMVRTKVKVEDVERQIVIEEFAIPGPLRRLLAAVVTTTDALHGLVRTDRSLHRPNEHMDDPLAVSDDALDHTPVYGMMGDDGAGGRITLCSGKADTDAQVHITWDGVGELPVFKGQMDALKEAHQRTGRLGGRVLPNPMWQPLPALGGLELHGPALTVHPLGGCPMGDTKDSGVVDPWGRVYSASGSASETLRGLAVLDGSIVPAALGINPSLTIAALAERAVPILAKDWNLRLLVNSVAQVEPRPQRRDLTRPTPPRLTTVRLRERMTGRIHVKGRAHNVSAEVEFAPVGAASLRRLPRSIAQPVVTLVFTDPDGSNETRAICKGNAAVLVREHSGLLTRIARSLDLARRKLGQFADVGGQGCSLWEFLALCSHLGQVRLIQYDWTVIDDKNGTAPVKKGQHLRLTKRIEFTETGNPWRQLSEGRLDLIAACTRELGQLVLDPSFFVEKRWPLLQVDTQQDEPNAIGDLAELGLWVLRVVLRIHLLNFLPADDKFNKSSERLPSVVDGVTPDRIDVLPVLARDPHLGTAPRRLLSRYAPRRAKLGSRPVLLIHGYGAGGSTFAHSSIPHNLVEKLLDTGREVWVLDLRTSIGLEQRVYWSFDDVAMQDIPDAITTLLKESGAPANQKVDVVAHCIGAAMFSVAVLTSVLLHKKIGAVVLSQVGPLLRTSPMNRLRGFLASYLQQYIGTKEFDVRPKTGQTLSSMLTDAVLATFPYPDDDGEAGRLKTLPGFAAVRHRADAIFGQTMRLRNIGDETLRSLDAIYGWVMVRGLAQIIHYARQQVLTDAGGQNQAVAFDMLGKRFGFPLLMLHGRMNAVFDWRGSYDTFWLLKQVFDKNEKWPQEPPEGAEENIELGKGTPRQLHVLAEYGHQDTLIGEHAHRDVFPRIIRFLDQFASAAPSPATTAPALVAVLPWIGPMLGRVRFDSARPETLVCLLSVRPPPGHASALCVVYVPARRVGDRWTFVYDKMVAAGTTRDDLLLKSLEVRLKVDRIAAYDGFAVVTVHNDLPIDREINLTGMSLVDDLFVEPAVMPPQNVHDQVKARLERSAPDDPDLAVVRLDPAWTRSVQADGQRPQDSLCFALASCQYPAGLVDRIPAQRSYERLAERLEKSSVQDRPQLLLLVGDQVYVDGTAGLFDFAGADQVDRVYELNFRLDALRRVTRSLPTYPILDDHEVEDNWEPAVIPSAAETAGISGYLSNQHKLESNNRTRPFNYQIAPAGFPFYVLDTRSTRERRALRRTAPNAALLNNAAICDMTGLLDWLKAAPADAPKFIVSPVALFPFPRAALFGHEAERLGLDDWSAYPRSQFELLELLRDGPARQVVILSGDRHMSSVSSLWLERAQGQSVEVISIVSSGLYAPWPFANSRADEFWLDGPLVMVSGPRTIKGTMLNAAVGTTDGYAVVCVERDSTGAWTLRVTLDLAEGALVCRRKMAQGDPSWVIDGPQGRRIRTF